MCHRKIQYIQNAIYSWVHEFIWQIDSVCHSHIYVYYFSEKDKKNKYPFPMPANDFKTKQIGGKTKEERGQQITNLRYKVFLHLPKFNRRSVR